MSAFYPGDSTVIGVSTFAARPVAPADGTVYRFSDIGSSPGTLWAYDSAAGYWRPVGGSALLLAPSADWSLGAAPGAGEVLLGQVFIPPGLLAPNGRIIILNGIEKTGGAADTVTFRHRLGGVGSLADNIVWASSVVAAAQLGMSTMLGYVRASNVSSRKMSAGTNSFVSIATGGTTGGAKAAAVGCADWDTSGNWFTWSAQMAAGAVETASVSGVTLEIVQ